MASPSLDVIAKRRYHKHRHQLKRKDRFKHNYDREIVKISSSKTNEPVVRITHRRLTNKIGFSLKGAVVTSPLLRGSKGQNVRKAAKKSSDYDLQRILRAAKNRDVSSESHSSGESIHPGGTIDSPDFLERHEEKERKRRKSFREITQFVPKPVQSQSSSDKNITTFDDDNQNYEVELQSGKTPSSNHSEIYQRGHDGNSKALKYQSVKLNSSNETSNASHQRKIKPRSLSAYQKFAVGIVEALCAEKKKQYPYPDNDWLGRVTRDLDNTYCNTHGKQSHEQFLPNMKAANITSNMSIELTGVGKLDIKEDKIKSVCQNESRPKIQPAQESAGHLQGKEDNKFKERRVEAWINAIPVHISNVDKKVDQKIQKPIKKITQLETEREFLRNVKNNSICNAKALNPFENVKNSSNWAVQSSDLFGHSPYRPPHISAPTKINKVNCTKRPLETEHAVFPQTQFGCHKKGGDRKPGVIWGTSCPNSPFLQHATHPLKPQQSWMCWFKDSNDNHSAKEKSQITDVPVCLSPFDPTPKLNRHNKEDYGGKENANTKDYSTSKPSMWSQFPKLLKKDKNKSTEMTNGFNLQKRNYNNQKPSPANTDLIKFSPRKMF